MAVFRVEKNKGYTVMSNHHLRNKELSLKAKGLLSQMLSLPEDWDYTLAGLSLINREKIDAIREAVRELENAGYIQRSRERDEKGRLRGTTYVIYEQPPKLDLPTLEKPTLDNPTLEKPTLENPTQLNKELLKTNLPKKEKLNTDISSTHSIPFRSLNPSPLEDAAQPPERKRKETEPSAFDIYEEIIKDNIEYDIFNIRKVARGNIHFITYLFTAFLASRPRSFYCFSKCFEVIFFYWSFCHIYSPSYILLFPFLLGYVYTVPLISHNNSYLYTCYCSCIRL